MTIGETAIQIDPQPKYRMLEEVKTTLPPLVGVKPAEGDKLLMEGAEPSLFSASVDPEAPGAEVMSAFQSAAFGGAGRVRAVPDLVIGHMGVPPAPGKESYLLRTLDWPERALIVVVGQGGVELWREGVRKGRETSPPSR